MEKMTIRSISGNLNQDDRLTICSLLIKAGYTVRITRVPCTKPRGKAEKETVIEFW